MLKNAGLRFVLVYDMPESAKQAAVDDLTGLLEASTLRHQVGLSSRWSASSTPTGRSRTAASSAAWS